MNKIDNAIKIFFVLSLLIISSCGESVVDVGRNTYSPKIVIDAYLYPGQKADRIKITRNIPVNTTVDPTALLLPNAAVTLTDMQSGKTYNLTFNTDKFYFEDKSGGLIIGYDKDYLLNVSAVVEGKSLKASSVTHTPRSGFRIIDEQSTSNSILYRDKEPDGAEKKITLTFNPSPGTSFYFFSIVSLDASDSTFIYDNPYIEVKKDDLLKEMDLFKYRSIWLQNINSEGSSIKYFFEWINFWFYGNYRIIAYACDDNFRLFNQTYKMVQDFDGNFHEPRLNVSGEGIGVFGSLIADTLYIKVKR